MRGGVSHQLVKPHPLVLAQGTAKNIGEFRHFSHASKLVATQSVSESFVDELNGAM